MGWRPRHRSNTRRTAVAVHAPPRGVITPFFVSLGAFADLSGAWIDRVYARLPQKAIVLDMDSSVSETSCHRFAANAVRLQLRALAYDLANFLRTLALPDRVMQWSMTTLRDRLVKIGAKIVRRGRFIVFQVAEIMVPRTLCSEILERIARLRAPPMAA